MVAFVTERQAKFTRRRVNDLNDLRELEPYLRGDIAELIRDSSKEEIHAEADQTISSMKVDGKRYGTLSGPKGGGISTSLAQAISSKAFKRVQIFYQGDTGALLDVVKAIWKLVKQQTPKSAARKSLRSYYFRGRTGARRLGTLDLTGQMSYEQTIVWIKRQSDPLTTVYLEGPQTPYRRKLIYDYTYGNRRRPVERIKPRGRIGNKTILDERYEFGGRYRLVHPRRGSKRQSRYEPFANKAFLKTIAKTFRGKYKDMWIGYRFVPSREGLKEYPSSTGPRPWGTYLPQIYIGLSPSRID